MYSRSGWDGSLTATEKVTSRPTTASCLLGCEEMIGGMRTVIVTSSLLAVPATLETWTR